MEKKRIVLFGTGALSKFLTEHIGENAEIVAYLRSDAEGSIDGKPILSIDQLQDVVYDYVVVAFGNTPRGIELLKNAGVPENKIVGYAYSGMTYENSLLQRQCEQFAAGMICGEKIPELFDVAQKRYFVCGMNVPESYDVIEQDYVREQTLAFLAEEIHRKDVKGSVAEIGVSSGAFARKINALFPDRKLYLFDTYEGLPAKDKDKAFALGWGERQYALDEHGTPPEQVLACMPYREMCEIKKGCFPETFDVKEPFAFVSLDVDFYDTVSSGLAMIYPLLSKGGYLMVHDYHNLSYVETKAAVIKFCDENGVAYVPIPDAGGSVILTK